MYAPIPETKPIQPGLERPYGSLAPFLAQFGVRLPHHLQDLNMHLDPDFEHLTYGDQGERAKQLSRLGPGDLLVFYAGLSDMSGRARLVYAIIGILQVDAFVRAVDVMPHARDMNAHSRRVLQAGSSDLIIRGRSGLSGRLERCIPIGEFRGRAYRLARPLLAAWGGISSKDGYLQRSARLPRLTNATRFYSWFMSQNPRVLQDNN